MVRIIRKIFVCILLLFFGSTILAVVVYRFVPVRLTPLMLIRSVETGRIGWHHNWVAIGSMSRYAPVAAMAGEDQRFLSHHGFDFVEIQHAAEKNNKAGRTRFGASTISQQTAKNVFLWNGRTWLRKGLEAYFTMLIELIWGKQRIMEVYLNSIEMGEGIYGIEAVARQHFGKTAAELSRSDCALIAATLPNPRKYSSQTPSKYVRARQQKIMSEMKHIPLIPTKSDKGKTTDK